MNHHIYYTGDGAKLSGIHTDKEFLKLMKKDKTACSRYVTEQEYRPCKRAQNLNTRFLENFIQDKTYTRSKKILKRYKRLFKKCEKRKHSYKKRKCELDDFILFSGAEKRIK
jgi:hypothetical protein